MRYMKYVKWPIVSSYNDSLRIKLEAENLMYRIKQGENFADIANAYTEDPSNNIVGSDVLKGGMLGWFGKGQMVKPFEEAAFEADKGQIIGPVVSRFGSHIISVRDKKTQDGMSINHIYCFLIRLVKKLQIFLFVFHHYLHYKFQYVL